MTKDLRSKFLSAMMFFVLIASAVLTVPARADSGTPPPAPSSPTGSTATTNVTKVPLAVTNTTGGGDQVRKVEFGSQKAAYVAPIGDPIWCPSSMGAPTPGSGACSTNYANMANLITYLTGNQKTVDGTIWINGSGPTDGSGPNTMDGSGSFVTMAAHKLTLKGGWTGVGGVINSSMPSLFSNTLNILHWGKDVTLSNVQFNNVMTGTERGLYITTKGNISLTNVQANNDGGYGAYLDNTSGNGSVTLTNSKFNGDAIPTDPAALGIYSHNAVTLTSVTVNGGWGTKIDNSGASNKPVTIKASSFDNNHWEGLTVLSKGAITLTDVSASGNFNGGAYGASLDNSGSVTAAPVTLTGTNIFDSNADSGLHVQSAGKITSGSLDANNNGGFGAKLDNHFAATVLPITLTGTSSFTGNGMEGLDLWSQGAITANNLSVDRNGSYGAWLYNTYGFTAPIKVTGTNWFANNGSYGLYVDSYGSIAMNNINANGNGIDGLYAENYNASTPQSLTLTGVNNFNQNSLDGAILYATGAIKLSNVNAFNNMGGTGLMIRNTVLGSTKPQSVTLLGTNSLTFNQADNLDISTYGAITVNNLTANFSSTGTGADLGYLGYTSGNVTMNGANTFDFNHVGGLKVVSKGAVLLNNLNASFNSTGTGVFIDNTASTTSSSVTLKGINTFKYNGLDGMDILSTGKVLLNSLNAMSNTGGNGVYIYNLASTTSFPVILTGINTFNYNSGGLVVLSKGAITTNNLTANENGNFGALFENYFPGAVGGINLKGSNVFLGNSGSDGLVLYSNGAITVAHITANYNYSDGMFVYTPGSVTVTCGSFMDNGTGPSGYGWHTGPSVPSIKLIGVDTSGNHSGDYLLDNPLTVVSSTAHTCTLP